MRWRSELRERVRALLFPRRVEAETEEEMRFHLDMEAEHRVRESGVVLPEARRQAAMAFGGVDKHHEQVREARGLAWLSGLSLDVKLGARMLVKYPGLTIAGGLALALAFALAASWFEFLGDMTNPRLPLEDAKRIVVVQNWDRTTASAEPRSLRDYGIWRDEVQSIDHLSAAVRATHAVTTPDNRFRPVRAARMSAAAFAMLRVRPVIGRTLQPADEEEGAPLVAVIGHGLWQEMFDGSREVLGRSITLGGLPATVVGVMPEGFGFPINQELWAPLRERPEAYEHGAGPPVMVFGRLARGMSREQAQTELLTISRRSYAGTREADRLRPRVNVFADATGMTSAIQLINVPFILFLIVVCANVATLGFARTAARSGELALRSALGASRKRLVLQLGAEALVLTATAAALGLAVANWGIRRGMDLFWEVQQSSPPFWFDPSLSAATLVYAAVLVVVAAGIIGGLPALKATGRRLRTRLVQTGSGGAGMRFGAISTTVIVIQVALCVAFLPYAILRGRELLEGRETEARFPADEFLAARVALDLEASATGEAEEQAKRERTELYAQLKQRLSDIPGVARVTLASRMPGFNHPADGVQLESDTAGTIGARVVGVDADFFRTMNARIVAGREFAPGDYTVDSRVVIADADWAREHLPARTPVGQRIRFADGDFEAASRRESGQWLEIVGVVEGMEDAVGPGTPVALYRPLRAGQAGSVQAYLRTSPQPATLVHDVEAAVTGVSPRLSIQELKPLDDIWRPVLQSNVFFLAVLNVVGLVILLFALAGVYALTSFTVTQRTREIAIRAALGAEPGRIVRSIFGRAVLQIGLGIVIGATVISLVVLREEGGPLLVASVALLMAVCGLAGCAVPARRALRIQPTVALKAE